MKTRASSVGKLLTRGCPGSGLQTGYVQTCANGQGRGAQDGAPLESASTAAWSRGGGAGPAGGVSAAGGPRHCAFVREHCGAVADGGPTRHVLCSEGRRARPDSVSGFQGIESLGDQRQSLGACHLRRGSWQATQALKGLPWCSALLATGADLPDACVDTRVSRFTDIISR